MKIYGVFLLISFALLGIVPSSIGDDVGPNDNPSFSGLQPFIVGGEEATKNEFPWLVHLSITTSEGTSRCGGALIQLNQVLTAAHCVAGATSITVTAGDHDLTVEEGTEQLSESKTIRSHENYRENENQTLVHDIALIELETQFTQTEAVIPIRLPAPNAIINSTSTSRGTVAGWGLTEEDGELSDILMKVTVPIVTDSSCTNLLGDRRTQFCAGAAGNDSCQGDSGGPFMCSDLPLQICGIVSYGAGCGVEGHPGVYTKVSSYVYWINGTEPPTSTVPPSSTPRTNSTTPSSSPPSLLSSAVTSGFHYYVILFTYILNVNSGR